ncbi:MAG: hypothetical protein CML73_01315 [Rhodobiaceae bacterium]|nr:hypothetical protein [Rhodobiaceae bacterium]
MTILDKAKFLLIPSGYKSAKVYSIFPSSGAFDFTFARTGDDATRQNVNGLIETKSANIPRLNHYNNGCPSLILEGSATNIQVRSEEFNNAAWTKRIDLTVTANQVNSPTGQLEADKIQRGSTSGSNNYIYDYATKSSASQLSVATSIFVKQGEGDFFAFRSQGLYVNGRGDAIYQFSTNTLTTSATGQFSVINSSVEQYPNGWFRISVTFNTDTHTQISTYFCPRATTGTIDTSDTSTTSFVYLWGCQVEESTGSSSYIKTEGNPVTRNFDNCVNTLTFTLGADATFYFDFNVETHKTNGERLFAGTNSGLNKFLRLQTYKSGLNYFSYISASSNNGTSNTLISTSENLVPFFQRNKLAIQLSGNTFKIFLNGSQIKTGTVTGNFDVLNGEAIVSDFGESVTGNSTRKIFTHAIFDETLTTTELTTLTTL